MQQMPLDFDVEVGTYLVWNNGTRWPIRNVFVSTGTWPKGSTWARNPIPRVADDNRGLHNPASCPGPRGNSGPGCIQFPAPCPQDVGREPWSTDGSGQGACSGDWTAGMIVDRVKIPENLPPGDYVLGWRWDCEETARMFRLRLWHYPVRLTNLNCAQKYGATVLTLRLSDKGSR